MEQKEVEQLAGLAEQIPARIRERYEQIEQWREELAALEGRRCTGRVTWRDKKAGVSNKMVITHKVGEGCPVHGEPGDNGRLRVYVGAETEPQQEAREAIELERQGKELEGKISAMESRLGRCQWELQDFYRAVGYRVVDGELVDEGVTSRW